MTDNSKASPIFMFEGKPQDPIRFMDETAEMARSLRLAERDLIRLLYKAKMRFSARPDIYRCILNRLQPNQDTYAAWVDAYEFFVSSYKIPEVRFFNIISCPLYFNIKKDITHIYNQKQALGLFEHLEADMREFSEAWSVAADSNNYNLIEALKERPCGHF